LFLTLKEWHGALKSPYRKKFAVRGYARELLTSRVENQIQDMKAKYKLTAGIVIATFAVTAASLSVDPAKKPVTTFKQYSEMEILFLSGSNRCSRKKAIEILETASEFPVRGSRVLNPDEK
jgi:hypothetical protein